MTAFYPLKSITQNYKTQIMKKLITLALVSLISLATYAQKGLYMVKTFNAAAIKT
ncbi:MAG: hypothetical protein ACI9IP_001968 [Arcticibacterium sp.]|jgi:hypothetical protein